MSVLVFETGATLDLHKYIIHYRIRLLSGLKICHLSWESDIRIRVKDEEGEGKT